MQAPAPLPHVKPSRLEGYDDYVVRVEGTTIDRNTLLSTDYFNSFNEVIMLMGMLEDTPDLLDEIKAWRFQTYTEHFSLSGLSFGPLAVEAYSYAPPSARQQFDDLTGELRCLVGEATRILSGLSSEGDIVRLNSMAHDYALQLQSLVEIGSSIVHGSVGTASQSDIDQLF